MDTVLVAPVVGRTFSAIFDAQYGWRYLAIILREQGRHEFATAIHSDEGGRSGSDEPSGPSVVQRRPTYDLAVVESV